MRGLIEAISTIPTIRRSTRRLSPQKCGASLKPRFKAALSPQSRLSFPAEMRGLIEAVQVHHDRVFFGASFPAEMRGLIEAPIRRSRKRARLESFPAEMRGLIEATFSEGSSRSAISVFRRRNAGPY